jgi:hypothetical protein
MRNGKMILKGIELENHLNPLILSIVCRVGIEFGGKSLEKVN